jgi:hypothetical protein
MHAIPLPGQSNVGLRPAASRLFPRCIRKTAVAPRLLGTQLNRDFT